MRASRVQVTAISSPAEEACPGVPSPGLDYPVGGGEEELWAQRHTEVATVVTAQDILGSKHPKGSATNTTSVQKTEVGPRSPQVRN